MEKDWNSHLGATVGELDDDGQVSYGLSVDGDTLTALKMQKGFHEEVGINGFVVEDLIDIAVHRIKTLDESLPSEDNKSAIVSLQQAKLHLANRERKRAKAGVLGTNEPLPEKPKVAKIQSSLPSFVFDGKSK